jgi:formiminotetrahydrofolate cyclodeaminase
MNLSRLPFTELLAAFRSKDPTPGGGSASALSGAVGASLLAMVAGLSRPRVHTEDDGHRLSTAGERSAQIGERLSALMDRDSDAYDCVVEAFRLPKSSDDEKRARSRRIQEALRSATEAPLEVMRQCADALQLAAVVAAFGNRNASSDVRVGVELLGAGLRGAKLNVDVNLSSLTDEAFAGAVRTEAERLVLEGEQRAATAVGQLESPG